MNASPLQTIIIAGHLAEFFVEKTHFRIVVDYARSVYVVNGWYNPNQSYFYVLCPNFSFFFKELEDLDIRLNWIARLKIRMYTSLGKEILITGHTRKV